MLAELDMGFTPQGFAVNLVLQILSALISVVGALLVARHILGKEIANDLATRRQEDSERRDDDAKRKRETADAEKALTTRALETLAADLALVEGEARDYQTRNPGYMTMLPSDSVANARQYLPLLPADIVVALMRADRAIRWFNSIPNSDRNKDYYLRLALTRTNEARKALDNHLGFDHDALAVAVPVREQ